MGERAFIIQFLISTFIIGERWAPNGSSRGGAHSHTNNKCNDLGGK